MDRRGFLGRVAGLLGLGVVAPRLVGTEPAKASSNDFEIRYHHGETPLTTRWIATEPIKKGEYGWVLVPGHRVTRFRTGYEPIGIGMPGTIRRERP